MKSKPRHCKSKYDLFHKGQCQGCSGHKGHHWFYEADGSLIQWRNDSDPKSKNDGSKLMKKYGGFGSSYIPPDHERYIHPKDKIKHAYKWLKYRYTKPKNK